jgi:hypothetical protein
MKRLAVAALVVALAGTASPSRAGDKPDPTGTWKYTIMTGNRTVEVTLKLKLEGDKLTGAVVGGNKQETPIEDAKYKDGEVSFKAAFGRDLTKVILKWSGKVSGDTFKGKTEVVYGGQPQPRDVEAKRVKD